MQITEKLTIKMGGDLKYLFFFFWSSKGEHNVKAKRRREEEEEEGGGAKKSMDSMELVLKCYDFCMETTWVWIARVFYGLLDS